MPDARERNDLSFLLQKRRSEGQNSLGLDDATLKRIHGYSMSSGLYGDLPPTSHETQPIGAPGGAVMQGGLPMPFPNPAPEVDLAPEAPQPPVTLNPTPVTAPYLPETHNEPRKKKYAKEAWPGKKPTPSLLIWSACWRCWLSGYQQTHQGQWPDYRESSFLFICRVSHCQTDSLQFHSSQAVIIVTTFSGNIKMVGKNSRILLMANRINRLGQ